MSVYSKIKRLLKALTNQADKPSSGAYLGKPTAANGFKVSTHALIRYFERIEGYDIDEVANLLTDGLEHKVKEGGNGKYLTPGGRVTVLGHDIVTVDPRKSEKRLIPANPIKGLAAWCAKYQVSDLVASDNQSQVEPLKSAIEPPRATGGKG